MADPRVIDQMEARARLLAAHEAQLGDTSHALYGDYVRLSVARQGDGSASRVEVNARATETEAALLARAKADRERVLALYMDFDASRHFRYCDRCWGFNGLSPDCPRGEAMLIRLHAIEAALGMAPS